MRKKNIKLTKEQQLNLCELTAMIYNEGHQTLEEAEKTICTVYKIAHLNGTCKNEHIDWHELGHKLGKEYKKHGIGDYNKER